MSYTFKIEGVDVKVFHTSSTYNFEAEYEYNLYTGSNVLEEIKEIANLQEYFNSKFVYIDKCENSIKLSLCVPFTPTKICINLEKSENEIDLLKLAIKKQAAKIAELEQQLKEIPQFHTLELVYEIGKGFYFDLAKFRGLEENAELLMSLLEIKCGFTLRGEAQPDSYLRNKELDIFCQPKNLAVNLDQLFDVLAHPYAIKDGNYYYYEFFKIFELNIAGITSKVNPRLGHLTPRLDQWLEKGYASHCYDHPIELALKRTIKNRIAVMLFQIPVETLHMVEVSQAEYYDWESVPVGVYKDGKIQYLIFKKK